MRLIDADEFIKILDSQELIEHLIKVGLKNSQNISFALAQVIDNRPTAYDIDKVVEELETMSQYITFKDMFAVHENVKMIATDTAIEIVKHGGVVCKKESD